MGPILAYGGVAFVALAFIAIFRMRPGLLRRSMIALLGAVLLTPTIVVGHGIGIAPASWVVFAAIHEGDWDTDLMVSGLVPIAVVWVIAVCVLLSTSKSATWRPASRTERGLALAVFAGLASVIAGSFLYRLYLREFTSTYGPFVVTVRTGDRALHDIVLGLTCESYSTARGYAHEGILESGTPHAFPAEYLAGLKGELDCIVYARHPYLPQYFQIEQPLRSLQPRTSVAILVDAPLWTDEQLRRILSGAEMTPGGENVSPRRRAEIAVYDEWGVLALQWVPRFCEHDFERIKGEYVAEIAARRNRLLFDADPTSRDPDAEAIVVRGWQLSCDYELQQKRTTSGR